MTIADRRGRAVAPRARQRRSFPTTPSWGKNFPNGPAPVDFAGFSIRSTGRSRSSTACRCTARWWRSSSKRRERRGSDRHSGPGGVRLRRGGSGSLARSRRRRRRSEPRSPRRRAWPIRCFAPATTRTGAAAAGSRPSSGCKRRRGCREPGEIATVTCSSPPAGPN